MKNKNKPVAIVGAGLGGLASACTLAARGHRVVLFETNAWLGGKAAVHEDSGFRFDMGPTILTMPSVLRRIFAEAGRTLESQMELVRLDPQWRSFFEGGHTLDLVENAGQMSRRIEEFSPGTGSGTGYERFLDLSRRQSDISHKVFFWRPVGGLLDMFSNKDGAKPATLRDVIDIRMGRSVSGLLRSYVPDERVSQMLDHFTQYVGSCPEQSPAVLCGIAHMQSSEGVWYPIGGTAAVPAALRKLAVELGVEIHSGKSVQRIVVENGVAVAVVTDSGERIEVSAVVSNRDVVRTHRDLIGGEIGRKFEGRRAYEPACSGVVLYLGLKKRYEQLLHHNFVFSEDPHREFAAIYGEGQPAPDPTCYVCAPAGTEPGVAPEGGEALYVLVHTPYLRPGHDWSRMLPDYRRVILDKLKRVAGMEDIEQRIVTERILTPQDIHDRYQVLNGAIYGLASHGRFTGTLKPSNRSPDVEGLYLAGGSAHPGPGMPMALMSGWIAADALHRDGGGASQSIPAGQAA
jgi:diapolycopene oxygenase